MSREGNAAWQGLSDEPRFGAELRERARQAAALERWPGVRAAKERRRRQKRGQWRRWRDRHRDRARAVKRRSAAKTRRADYIARPPRSCGACGVAYCTVPGRRPAAFCGRACRARSYRLRSA